MNELSEFLNNFLYKILFQVQNFQLQKYNSLNNKNDSNDIIQYT